MIGEPGVNKKRSVEKKKYVSFTNKSLLSKYSFNADYELSIIIFT